MREGHVQLSALPTKKRKMIERRARDIFFWFAEMSLILLQQYKPKEEGKVHVRRDTANASQLQILAVWLAELLA